MHRRPEPGPAPRLFLWALLLAWLLAAWPARAETTFLEPEQAFRLNVETIADGKVALDWTIAPGYYLYRERITVAPAGAGTIAALTVPPGEAKDDPNFGRVEVFHDSVRVEVDAAGAAALQVGWQGCADEGLCYPPQQRTVALRTAAGGAPPAAGLGAASLAAPASAAATPLSASALTSDSAISRMWSERSLAWTLPLAFVLGIALAFTPCVLPMVPIISGVVVGRGASPRRAFALALSFVLAMALVYAGLGLLAAVAGAGLQALLQNPWTLLGFAALFVVLALAMFGLFELQLPAFLRDRLARGPATGGSVPAAATMGALSALLVGPCMTAPLAGTLLYIAQSGNALEGGLLLLALGLGMGVPLLVISTVGAHWLPRPGPWMNRVKAAFGFLMLGMAIWMAERVISPSVALLLWGALLTAIALTLWHLARPAALPEGTPGPLVLRSSAAILGLWGAAMVVGAAAGATDPSQPLAPLAAARAATTAPAASTAAFETISDPAVLQARLDTARSRKQPALVEFSAEWCTSCKTIEREVFGDAEVQRALDGVLLLRADVTAGDAAQRALMRRHQVMGPPTVMLFDAAGGERRADRLVGEFGPDDLLRRRPAGERT